MDISHYMGFAIDEARIALAEGEIPVGAVLIDNANGEVIAKAHNATESKKSPLAHAEMLCLEASAKKRGTWRLLNTTLYVTLEPCAMCAGAILNARVPKIVYGAIDKRAGAFGGSFDLTREVSVIKPEVTGGVMGDECRELLSEFFKAKRESSIKKPEYFDIYDKDKKPTGMTARRNIDHIPDGYYYIATQVAVKRLDGRILLTLRSPEKKTYPNMWEIPGGLVQAGETSLQGVCRELMEETGLKRHKEDFKLIKTRITPSGMNPKAFCFVDNYLVRTEVSDSEIRLQKGETADYRWVTPEEFGELAASGKLASGYELVEEIK